MKIVCDSCSAKYSIADEKVAGRVFKIRCKKCGAAIVVRGDQIDVGGGASETEEASTRVADYSGDAVWHIVVDGEQQGPFAPAQLGEMLSAGTIGWDAYVWREGFDDWKPAQDIEDLVQAIMGGSQGAEASSAGAEPAGAEPAGADPFAATQHGAGAEPDAGVFGAQPASVAARNADAGADLFAQTDTASPFGASGGDEEDDVVASAPSPRVSADQALTGARNENSVLFSLSNLQALATGPGGGGSAAPSSASSSTPSASPKPGMAQGEGSGLIDIRALASATGVAPGSSGPVTSASTDNKVDDLLSIGGTGAGGLGSSLGAPVLIPEKKQESNKTVIIAVAAAAAVAVVAVVAAAAVVMTGGDDDETTVAAAGTVAPGQTVTAAGTGATPPAAADTPAAAEPAAPTPGAAIPEPAEAEEAEEPEEEAEAESGGDDGARRATKARRRARRQAANSGGGSAPARAAAAPSRSRRSGGGGDIDDLLNSAIGGGGGGGGGGGSARSGGGGSSSGPQQPSRSAVVSAMNGVKGAVRACGNGASGMATVRVTFAGSSGRATSANVTGSLPGPVKSCISRAVRGARVPPFQRSSFSITYPFPL